jgi:predicted metal-dependent hydrolase
MTQVANALHLLFPPVERWMVRTAAEALPAIAGTELHADVRGFMGQESTHARGHRAFEVRMREQGLELDGLIEPLEDRLTLLGRTPLRFRLAVMSSLEHYTAEISGWVLAEEPLEGSDPTMKDLLEWHAAEEVEHMHVAFDLREALAPGYTLRIGAHLLTTMAFAVWWSRVSAQLLARDPEAGLPATARDFVSSLARGDAPFLRLFPAFFSYLPLDFAPRGDRALALRVLDALRAA